MQAASSSSSDYYSKNLRIELKNILFFNFSDSCRPLFKLEYSNTKDTLQFEVSRINLECETEADADQNE